MFDIKLTRTSFEYQLCFFFEKIFFEKNDFSKIKGHLKLETKQSTKSIEK